MKKVYFPYIVLLLTITISCQHKQAELSGLNFNLNDSTLYDEAGSLAVNTSDRLTQVQYDSLQIVKIADLQGYEANDLTMGRILLDNEFGKILTIYVVTEGEITEYLISYDANNNLRDNLLVAYEDMVEYYSAVSSKVNDDNITVQTINYTYEDAEGNVKETADTSFVSYQITPDLKFIKQ